MQEQPKYPNLELLFGAYLNQDYDLHGETVYDVLLVYRGNISEDMRQAAVLEIERFKADHRGDLESAFELAYEREISIKSHGYTAQSFLEELLSLLSA